MVCSVVKNKVSLAHKSFVYFVQFISMLMTDIIKLCFYQRTVNICTVVGTFYFKT